MRRVWARVLLAACAVGCGGGDAGGGDGTDATNEVGVDAPVGDGSRDVADASDASSIDAGDARAPRGGRVHLDGRALADDGGTFVALGASLFWAAWGFENDKPRLESALSLLSKNGFQYIRALGVVGDPKNPDSWDGREIDRAWPDYDAVIAGVTDLAWKKYGVRVEWTIIADGQITVPTELDKRGLIERFLTMTKGREDAIMHLEIVNESFKNGFDGADGLSLLRTLTKELRDRTDLLVAASAPATADCAGAQAIYFPSVADLATIHFDRDTRGLDGNWGPVRQPWWVLDCPDLPPASNNEPIGPGSSVSTENDPERLVAAPLVTWLSGLPLHVFHSSAGVRGIDDLATMAGLDAFAHLHDFVPPDLPNWTRKNAQWADSPFQIFASDEGGILQADKTWPELPKATSGVVRAYGAVSGDDFFVVPIGIMGKAIMAPRRAAEFDVIDPRTGATTKHLALAKDERFELPAAQVAVLRGRYR